MWSEPTNHFLFVCAGLLVPVHVIDSDGEGRVELLLQPGVEDVLRLSDTTTK